MIIYNQPNYSKAEIKAYETIITSKTTLLPINLKVIINQFHNLHLQKYSTFARDNGMTVPGVCALLNSEEGCLWRRNDNQYIIFYNDTVRPKERIRFTIAHEIGHFVLGHLEFANKTNLSRYSLSDLENKAFEKEANYFAKRILAPMPVVYDFISIWNRISADLITDIFDVSFTVSSYIIGDLKRARKYGFFRDSHKVNSQFNNFIEKIKYALWCNTCSFSFSSSKGNYCPICGKDNLINDSMHIIRRSNKMIYFGYELDENMRAKQCPRCGNEEVNGDYCKICGIYLFNVCTGIDPKENSAFDNQYTRWDQLDQGCEKPLEGNARYCPSCGATSSFFEEQVLTGWCDETTKKNQQVSPNGIGTVIPDDGLPF